MPCRFEPIDICSEPCIQDLQSGVDDIRDRLDALEIINSVLSLLQDVADGKTEGNQYVDLVVPIASCKRDGTVELQPETLRVHNKEQLLFRKLFEEIAFFRRSQNPTERFVERVYNVINGDGWFKGEGDKADKERRDNPKLEKDPLMTLLGLSAAARFIGSKQKDPKTQGKIVCTDLLSALSNELSPLAWVLGLPDFPVEVPPTLLSYSDKEKLEKQSSYSELFAWYIKQFDALLGEFPITIEIEDSDPLQQGNQTKKIELPNISEALAELFGLAVSGSTNADLSINFLMRLASEVIATKNSSLITQDYVKANAAFLGYRGNPKAREINYSFNPAKLEALGEFLKESKGKIIGWEEDDKESVVGFLQRIVYASGIIKAAFLRNGKQMDQLKKEIESLTQNEDEASKEEWKKILELITNPEGMFSKESIPKPVIDIKVNPNIKPDPNPQP